MARRSYRRDAKGRFARTGSAVRGFAKRHQRGLRTGAKIAGVAAVGAGGAYVGFRYGGSKAFLHSRGLTTAYARGKRRGYGRGFAAGHSKARSDLGHNPLAAYKGYKREGSSHLYYRDVNIAHRNLVKSRRSSSHGVYGKYGWLPSKAHSGKLKKSRVKTTIRWK